MPAGTVTISTPNLVMGPGYLYTGAFGAAEPADSAVNSAPAASAWTGMGGTDSGCKLSIEQKYTELSVDQVVDSVGRRLTSREITVSTNLAEPTLSNFSAAMNGGTSASGTGWASYEPNYASSATQPTYTAAILDGYAPGGNFNRRAILRKVLSTDKIEQSYMKDKQTFVPITFTAHFVSTVIAPFHIVDQTA
jgi:hypothetical protein